jgi:hypothetical protein
VEAPEEPAHQNANREALEALKVFEVFAVFAVRFLAREEKDQCKGLVSFERPVTSALARGAAGTADIRASKVHE